MIEDENFAFDWYIHMYLASECMGDSGHVFFYDQVVWEGLEHQAKGSSLHMVQVKRESVLEGRVLDVFNGSICPGMSGKHGYSPLYRFE